AMPGRDGSLSVSASLEPQATGARPPREDDAAELCEGLSQAQQERCERCGCDLRGSGAAIDAVCSNQDERAAGWLDAAPNPAIAGASAHDVEQRPARALGGTGHRVGEGTQWHQSMAWH